MSMVSGVVGGVDTHADEHVGAVIDTNGGILGIESFPVGESGYGARLGWLSSHGEVQMVGVEGTGSWGVGLARFLRDREIIVIEVDRQNRQNRRKVGKSDTTDAVAAARAALSGSARVIPKARNGPVEQIRILMVARRSARTQRIATLNQLRHLVFTGPEQIRVRFKDRYKTGLVSEAAAMRPRKGSHPIVFTTNVVIRDLARRIRGLNVEMRNIDQALVGLIDQTAPSLLALYGVGVDTDVPWVCWKPIQRASNKPWANQSSSAPLPWVGLAD
jgi:transposase